MGRMEATDEAIVEQVLGGDANAFRVLVERYSRMVFATAFRMTGDEHDAEDVVQETFLRAYRSLRTFELRSSFSTWLFRIAVNCGMTTLRVREKTPLKVSIEPQDDDETVQHQLRSTNPGPDRMLYGAEMQERLASAMKLLSPMEKTAFVLRHFEDRSIEEIASVLQVRGGAVKHSIFRAVHKLREALEPALRSMR